MRKYLLLSVVLVLSYACASYSDKRYDGLTEYGADGKPVEITPDAYILFISSRFAADLKVVQSLRRKGFGRNELIRLFLLRDHTGQDVEQFAKERQKGFSYSQLSEKYKLNYEVLLKEAESVRKEIDLLVRSSIPPSAESLIKSTGTR